MPQEWQPIAYRIKFKYAKDNLFSEIKEREIINDRMNTLTLMAPFVGRYYSNEWVRKNVLNQTDEDIEEMDAQIAEEMQNPLYQMPLMGGMPGMEGGGGMPGMGGPPQQPGATQPQPAQQQQNNINKSKKPAKK